MNAAGRQLAAEAGLVLLDFEQALEPFDPASYIPGPGAASLHSRTTGTILFGMLCLVGMLCYVMVCYVMLCLVGRVCYGMDCYGMLCLVGMVCYGMDCYGMLCLLVLLRAIACKHCHIRDAANAIIYHMIHRHVSQLLCYVLVDISTSTLRTSTLSNHVD